MEEKERYKFIKDIPDDIWEDKYYSITDTETGEYIAFESACAILNEKDKHIKELEEENKQLNSQPKEIVEKIKERVLKIDKTKIKTLDNGYSTLYCDRPTVITILDTILKEYGE